MTQDEIIRMAREVWGERAVLPFNDLERFAALVAAHEREKQDELNQLEKTLCSFWKPQKEEVESLTFTYAQVKAHIQAAVLTEREACAQVCDSNSKGGPTKYPYCNGLLHGAGICATDIRARSEK